MIAPTIRDHAAHFLIQRGNRLDDRIYLISLALMFLLVISGWTQHDWSASMRFIWCSRRDSAELTNFPTICVSLNG